MKSPCPFCHSYNNDLTLAIGFFFIRWHVQCDCGACGPAAPSRNMARVMWMNCWHLDMTKNIKKEVGDEQS